MQRDPSFFDGKISSADGYGVGGNTHSTPFGGHYTCGAPAAPAFGAALAGSKHAFPCPLNGVEFQPSETCPKNFVIFDQTVNKSRVLFHPALAHKLNCPDGFDNFAVHAFEGGKTGEKISEYEEQFSPPHKEDTEDINALLSSEEDEEDEDDEDDEDDMVSTARTPAIRGGGSSPDSAFSSQVLKSHKLKSPSIYNSVSSGASSNGVMKRDKMRKMVKALRGIIPGGDEMDTPAVLDEAVKYLKSLKVEVKKLGIQNFED